MLIIKPQKAKLAAHTKEVLQKFPAFDEHPQSFFPASLPLAQLTGQSEASSSGEAGGSENPNFVAMAKSNIVLNQSLIKGNVFEISTGWQAAYKSIRAG